MVVGVALVDNEISKEWRATGQGVYSTAMNGIGAGLGIYMAGMIFEWFGIRMIWALNIGLGVIGILLIGFALTKFNVIKPQTEEIKPCRTM